MLKQMQSMRTYTTFVLLTKRFETLQGFLVEFWVVFHKNMDNEVLHNRIQNKLGTSLHDRTVAKQETEEIEKIKKLLARHNKFDE